MISKLGLALRRKYRSPREALRALGLDEKLLSLRRLAFDSGVKRRAGRDEAPNAEPDLMELYLPLEELLSKHLSGPSLHEALDLLGAHLGTGDFDGGAAAASDENEEDTDENEADWRSRRRQMMATVAKYMSEKKNMTDDEIASELADFPLKGIPRRASDEDLDALMKDRRDRVMARDARLQRRAFDYFPEAKRLNGTALETLYGARPEEPVATHGDAYDYFPEALRIGLAPGRST